MEQQRIALGDVVFLKYGGPLMTVCNAGTDSSGFPFCRCHWFVDGTVQSFTFASEVLEKPENN
jgi:uncharacterized protein YodC (DUF2158 family)